MHQVENSSGSWIVYDDLSYMMWFKLYVLFGVISSLVRRHVEQYYLVTRSDWWVCLYVGGDRAWSMCDSGPGWWLEVTLCLCSPVSRDIVSAPVSPAGEEIKWPDGQRKVKSRKYELFQLESNKDDCYNCCIFLIINVYITVSDC